MEKLPLRSVDFNILLVAVLYYLSAELGFFIAVQDTSSLPFWPPAGVAFALIILYGRSVWPGIAIGSLIFTVENFWFNPDISHPLIIAMAGIITASRIAEPIAGQVLLDKLVRKKYPFSKTIHAFHFVFITLLISAISSGGTLIALAASGTVKTEEFLRILFTLWTRNSVGILLFTPLLLSVPDFQWKKMTYNKIGELAAFLLCFAGMLFLFNLDVFRSVFQYAIPFAVIPFLLWLAFRFEGAISIAGFIGVALAAIYFTSQAKGPFYLADQNSDSVLLLQVYVVVISVSSLVLTSAVHERQEAQADLKKFNENLEVMVQARTIALEEEIKSRHEAQQKLLQTNEELTKRNTELDNFVYSVSHDLRAPISSILGLIHLAKMDDAKNVKNIYLDRMEKSTRQQDHFIREILDQSRNSRLEIKREPILFESLIEEAFEQLDYSNLNGNKFEKIITVEQSQPFYCDKWRLKVILNNIISNSIRYKNGREPVIKINARVGEHQANVCIEDNGKGISKEHLSNLGKMFYRATDEGAGSGLGLYIVKEAVQKLKGSLVIESEEGQGTLVKLNLPEVEG